MTKIFLIVILVLIIACVVLAVIIKCQTSKNKTLENQIENYKNSYFELNDKFEKTMGELEIEKESKEKLAKKLADISCMSIDDVLSELQHD